ncbi:TIR domain protein [compost metagenome]
MKVFLSHSSKDKSVVRPVASYLESQGFKVWLDEWEMTPGDSLIEKISEGIEESDKLVVFLTPDSIESNWVKNEVYSGLIMEIAKEKGLGGKFVIPVLLRACKVPIMLRGKLYADFTFLEFDKACESLVDGLLDKARRADFEPYSNFVFTPYDLGHNENGHFLTVLEFTSNLSPISGATIDIHTDGYVSAGFRVGESNNPKPDGFIGMNLTCRSKPFQDGFRFAMQFSAPELKRGISCYVTFVSKEPLQVNELTVLDGYGKEI